MQITIKREVRGSNLDYFGGQVISINDMGQGKDNEQQGGLWKVESSCLCKGIATTQAALSGSLRRVRKVVHCTKTLFQRTCLSHHR